MNLAALRKELSRTCSAIWALDQRRAELVMRAMDPRASDRDVRAAFDVDETQVEVEARIGEPQIIPGPRGGKATAIVYARGVAMYDFEYQPYVFSTSLLAQRMDALANDPAVGMIVLDVDSPGGVVTGTPEAADAIHAAAKRKKVVALVNPLCASAGYWLASQANEIIAVPSADIGSIGVYQLHWDDSQFWADRGMKPEFIEAPEGGYKTEGSWFFPMSDEGRAFFQGEVNKIYRQFTSAVARGRGAERSEVEENYGKGRTFMAADAKKAGLIDVVATVGAALTRLKLVPANGPQTGAALVLHAAQVYEPSTLTAEIDSDGGIDSAAPEDVMVFGQLADDVSDANDALTPEPQAITIHRIEGKDYVAEDWPLEALISEDFFTTPDDFVGISTFGSKNENLRVEVANGFAEYLFKETRGAMAVGVLINSEFTGRPAQIENGQPPENDPTTPDGRPTCAEATARRLRLLELG